MRLPVNTIALSLVAPLLACFSGLAHSQEHFELTPSISVSEEYDDNIYLDHSNKKSDFITTVSPGLTLSMLKQHTTLSLTYSPSFVFYAKESDNNYVGHAASLALDQLLTQYLSFNLTDSLIRSDDPLADQQDLAGERRGRRTYWRNSARASFNYRFAAEDSLSAGYGNTWLDSSDPEENSGMVHSAFGNLTHYFDVKNGMALDYTYTVSNLSGNDNGGDDDFTGHGAGVRYLRRLTPHSSGYLGYHFTIRDYDQSSSDQNTDNGNTDYKVHEGMAGYEQALSETFSFSGGIGYFIQERDEGGNNSGPTFNAQLTKAFERGTFTAGANGGWGESYVQSDRSNFVKYYGANVGLNYQLLQYLSGHTGVSYRWNEDDQNEKWETWRGSAGLSWSFLRWYSLSLDYSRSMEISDIEEDEYVDNRVMLLFRASKPFRL